MTQCLLIPLLLSTATNIQTAPAGLVPSPTQPTQLQRLVVSQKSEAKRAVFNALGSETHQRLDPTLAQSHDPIINVWKVGQGYLVQVLPRLWSPRRQEVLPVMGAARVFRVRFDGQGLATTTLLTRAQDLVPLAPVSAFVAPANEMLKAAHSLVPNSLLPLDALQKSQGLWTAQYYVLRGEVHAAYRVRLPTLSLKTYHDIWLDAQSLQVLGRQPVAKFAPTAARVFNPSPDVMGVDAADLVDVTLQDIITEDPLGDYLSGWHLQPLNCCKQYTCNLADTDPCPPEERVCAEFDDPDTITSNVIIPIPGELIDPRLSSGTIYVQAPFCTEKPRLQSSNDATLGDGFWATPVDVPRQEVPSDDAMASEEDAFSEVQTYYHSERIFLHFRDVLEDPTWCLGGLSMACEPDGTATLDGDGRPSLPFHISNNFLFPSVDGDTISNLVAQIIGGLGTDINRPAVIEDYMRIGNAVFLPALDSVPIEVPPEFAPVLQVFARPFDSNMYFQGPARDFGYDGDVVYHEFMHGITHAFNPDLGGYGVDRWGAHAQPGAMNEGWSDFFAAVITNDSLTAEYVDVSRELANDDRCPSTSIGEVHYDSLPFSGTLWRIHGLVTNALDAAGVQRFHQLVIESLAASASDETFGEQIARLRTAMADDGSFDALLTDIDAAIAHHDVSECARIWPLFDEDGNANPMPSLFHLTPGNLGLGDIAPSVVQFEIPLPVGTDAVDLSWLQQNSGGFGGLGGSSDPVDILVISTTKGPIEWRYDGGLARPYDANGDAITWDDDADVAELLDDGSAVFRPTFRKSCNAQTLHVALASSEGDVVLSDITAVRTIGTRCEPPKGCGCAGGAGASWLMVLGLGLVLRRYQRKRMPL